MNITCPLCRSDRSERLGKRTDFRSIDWYARFVSDIGLFDRELHECRVCGFQFIHPVYGEDEFCELYNQPGYATFVNCTRPFDGYDDSKADRALKVWGETFLAAGVKDWLKEHRASHSVAPTFLDVGCGRGHNMVIFKRFGFGVQGIDLSETHVAHVRDQLGFSVRKMSLEDLDASEQFDCVAAVHVIEHVACPHRFMESLLRVLRPNGLLILQTPLTMDWGRQQQRYCDIYHTFFFDHFTLGLLAAMHGVAYRQSVNGVWKDDANFVDMIVSLQVDPGLKQSQFSDAQIRSLRACYDGVQSDYLKFARYYLGKEAGFMLKRDTLTKGWNYLRQYGVRKAAARTIQFLQDHYSYRIKKS
jgi:ubiquinone/menaquinone biosynthesis C-methylase UbiE